MQVRGQEGRAGMAAILDPNDNIKVQSLSGGVRKVLPFYARPIFIRIVTKMDMTGPYNHFYFHLPQMSLNVLLAGTYKMKKVDLQKEGFNPAEITDTLYYLDSSGTYSPLTREVYEKIDSGAIRL